MVRLLTSTALALALVAGSAWGQMSSGTPQSGISAMPGSGHAGYATTRGSGTFSTLSGERLMASDLIGSAVQNQDGDDIGEIEDILLTQDGQVDGFLISVGDFLGIGGKYVGVHMDKVKFTQGGGTEPNVVISMSRDELNQAPEYGGSGASGTPATGGTR